MESKAIIAKIEASIASLRNDMRCSVNICPCGNKVYKLYTANEVGETDTTPQVKYTRRCPACYDPSETMARSGRFVINAANFTPYPNAV